MKNRLIRLFNVSAILCLLFIIVYYYFYLIFPFLIAGLFALWVQPFVSYIEKKLKINRMWSTIIVLLSSISMFTFFFWIISKLLWNEAHIILYHTTDYVDMMKQFNAKLEQVILPIANYLSHTFLHLPIITEFSLQSYGDELIESFFSSLLTIFQAGFTSITRIFNYLTQLITLGMVILVATFIIIYDYHLLKEKLLTYLPDLLKRKLNQLYLALKKSLFQFIKAQISLAFYTACIVFIGLYFFRIEHAFLLALLVFFIDFFPYLGIGLLFLPWLLYLFFIGNYLLTIQLTLLYMLIIIVRQVIEPKIMAKSIGLHPLVTVFVIFFGITQFGLIGILLTPILLIIISAIYQTKIIPAIYTYVKEGK